MPVAKGTKRVYFPKVIEARESLREKALELFESYMQLAAQAAGKDDFETAEKIYRFLIEHMPEEAGKRLIDSSAAKPKEIEAGSKQPVIQIGIALGGTPKALPPSVIDITPEDK